MRRLAFRGVLTRLVAAALGVTLAGLLGEGLLRARFEHLPPKLRGFLSNCYDPTDDVNGICYVDPRFGLTLPRPDFSTTCAWNALSWQHHGDHDGFRNPETPSSPGVALLGDSIVYGHGVEEPDTIAGCLRSQFGLTAANFGITGASPVHYVAFARNYALRLHPQALVVVVFANDLSDISAQRSAGDIRAFDERREAAEMQIFPPDALARFAPKPSRVKSVLERSFFLRTVRYGLHRRLGGVSVAHAEAAAGSSSALELERGSGPSVTYLKTALRVISEGARHAHSILLVLYVPAVQREFLTENRELPKILSGLAEREGFLFLDSAESLMAGPEHEKPGTRLVNDGHLSGMGACLVAKLIAERLRDAARSVPLGVRLSIASPWVRLTDFWDVESDEQGSFAWTKAESALEVSGLPPGVPLKVTLHVQHAGPSSRLVVTSADGERREMTVSSGARASVLAQTLRADDQGRLSLRLVASTFRPSDLGRPSDPRDLGVALSGIEIERDASASRPAHE